MAGPYSLDQAIRPSIERLLPEDKGRLVLEAPALIVGLTANKVELLLWQRSWEVWVKVLEEAELPYSIETLSKRSFRCDGRILVTI